MVRFLESRAFAFQTLFLSPTATLTPLRSLNKRAELTQVAVDRKLGLHVPQLRTLTVTVEQVRFKVSQGSPGESGGWVQGFDVSEELGGNPHSVLTPGLVAGVRRRGGPGSPSLLVLPADSGVGLQILHQDIVSTVATQLGPGATVIFMFLQLGHGEFQIAVLAEGKSQGTLGFLMPLELSLLQLLVAFTGHLTVLSFEMRLHLSLGQGLLAEATHADVSLAVDLVHGEVELGDLSFAVVT